MLSDLTGLVADAHQAHLKTFVEPILMFPIPDKPRLTSADRKTFRSKFLVEERLEFDHAQTVEDEADALVDSIIVALGGLIEMGVAPRAAIEEVMLRNATKQRGVKATRLLSAGYDAIKPEGWIPPDYGPLLRVTLQEAHMLDALRKTYGNDYICNNGQMIRRVDWQRESRLTVLVIGHARHGKDSVSEMLHERYGLSFSSSSMFCAERIVMPTFPPNTYQDVQACYDDRVSHRKHWYDTIVEYNAGDPARLAREMLESGSAIYCGMRSAFELGACVAEGLFDVIVWVDASDRVGPESSDSCTVTSGMADHVIDNNGTVEDLEHNVRTLFDRLFEEAL